MINAGFSMTVMISASQQVKMLNAGFSKREVIVAGSSMIVMISASQQVIMINAGFSKR